MLNNHTRSAFEDLSIDETNIFYFSRLGNIFDKESVSDRTSYFNLQV